MKWGMMKPDRDSLEWRLRYQSGDDHATARQLCIEAADEIARLHRLLNWCRPRLNKSHMARLDQYQYAPRPREPDDFLPIVRG